MSAKKKNPLKDLDAFLKQEASSLVDPPKIQATSADTAQSEQLPPALAKEELIGHLLTYVRQSDEGVDISLRELILHTLEKKGIQSAGDKMLINTILYLSHQDNWKEVIKNYWASKG
jgi:hypothetical protein